LPPSIGNAVSQRQPRTGRGGDPSAESRGQQQFPNEFQLPLERIEFQDFVAQSTGRDLSIFGSELFRNVPSTFAPVDNVPVAADYLIGPGDEILVRAWGQLDIDYTVTVDRTGAINIPKIGSINVAGIKYQDLQAHLKAAIGRIFRNFEIAVSLGQLRSIQVFVVGQARRPGSYSVGSMSTLVNAVFAAGGPSAKGSMRGIQLKRGSKVVTELDLYDLLINGDKSKDAPLLPGDVIHFRPVGALVAISGSVNVPAIYELGKDGTLSDLISWAGGLASTASSQRATVERIDERDVRKVDSLNLGDGGKGFPLRNGDLVNIFAVTPRFDNAVTLRGNVAQPARFPWRQGMRVTDLIPRVDALLSRNYWLRRNQAVGLDSTIADLVRRNQAAGVDIPVADLLKKNLQSAQQEADATLADSMRRTQITADVATVNSDAIKKAATLQMPQAATAAPAGQNAGQGVQLGLQERQERQERQDAKGGTKLADEIRRNLSEINWNYAVVERLSPVDLTTALVPFNLGKAILEGDPSQNILLQPGDVVTIFSVDDIQVPVAKQTKYVRLEGEFVNAGIYRVGPGETLRQLVARVGGLTPNAYLFGSEFTRESNRIAQQKKLEETTNRLEREIQSASISRSKNVTTVEEGAGLTQEAQAQQALIARLRQVKAAGRIVLEMPVDDATSLKDIPDLVLEDSDRFLVPSKPSTISVIGAVYNENAFVYSSQKRMTDYLRQAGGVSRTGNTSDVYLLRVDGSVISKRESGWLMSSFEGERLMPGDTIVVPEDFERTTWTKLLKDYGQILYQFGLGAAALKVIRQ
jgi:protein involved in polysaccharide export with SLBB domain